ncbi:MAG: hypothetical protein FWE10_06450 [Rikenellaceae bacterium]|nr:hypothetical protein [Rikenellaceae bacterium]MCL2691815.1 hypothetical protein [Rikenellaceae bacterium]
MEISLDTLIVEGKEIKDSIKYVPPVEGTWRNFHVYAIKDNPKYEVWKNKTIRFLGCNFKEDRCISDFENAVKIFEKSRFSPSDFDKLIGILESCKIIPKVSQKSSKNMQEAHDTAAFSITLNQNQHQNQDQSTVLVLQVFIDSIKDELTGKQYKELTDIVQKERDINKAKPKIIEKIKNFGIDTASNIIANIITNPTVLSKFM